MTLLSAILAVSVFSRPMERVSTLDPAMCRSIYDARAVELVAETALGIDYAAQRKQFGKPIGSFQAVKGISFSVGKGEDKSHSKGGKKQGAKKHSHSGY